jgi:hypothetical protein
MPGGGGALANGAVDWAQALVAARPEASKKLAATSKVEDFMATTSGRVSKDSSAFAGLS